MGKPKRLSKSRMADGLTCHKKMYLSVNQPGLAAPVTPALQARFDSGTEVGVRAREEFPGGHFVDRKPWEIEESIKETQEAIASGANTIYEATFGDEKFHCRLDILHRDSKESNWDIYEVKSGLDAKPEYILDLAIQCWILNQVGVKWKKASILHLNRECTHPDLSNLFVRSDVTDSVNDILSDFSETAGELIKVVNDGSVPDIDIGRHCDSPYECSFKQYCWSHVPTESIFRLPLPWRLFDKGHLALSAAVEKDLSNSQKRPFKVLQSGEAFIDKKGLKKATSQWSFPIYHLDFETIGPAIPKYPGTRPYTAIPFQFSLHIQDQVGKAPIHFEYLHDDLSDPRRSLAEKLIEYIQDDEQPIMAFNAGFEKRVLESLAKMFPDLAERLLNLSARLLDPHPVIKENVYHPNFDGMFKLKKVAPALLGEKWDYSKLEVFDGTMAQIAFDKMTDPKTGPNVKADLRQQLLDYCTQDTLAMVELVNWIYSNSK